MGNLKFYKVGQSVWEAMQFGTTSFNSSAAQYQPNTNDNLVRYAGNLNGLIFTDKELTTVKTDYKYPFFNSYYSTQVYNYNQLFLFNASAETSSSGYQIYHFASSNSTHDFERVGTTNKVADALSVARIISNGKLFVTFTVTNNGTDAVDVKAIERVGNSLFTKGLDSTSAYGRYLAWAYYLDEPVHLEAGETDTITISITLSDLTQ